MSSYRILPTLSPDARLRASIAEKGVLVAVEEVDESGVILDGYHRDTIARGLNSPYRTVVRTGLSQREQYRDLVAARASATSNGDAAGGGQ